MDYKITCICGHQFLISDDQLKAEILCPVCHQRLSPAIQAPATPTAPPMPPTPATTAPASIAPAITPATTTTPDSPEPTKRCPFCGEVILAIARKCKHCNEFLDRPPPGPPAPLASPNPSASFSPAAPSAGPASAPGPLDPVFSLYTSQWDNFWRYLTLAAIVFFITFILAFFPSLHPYLPVGALGSLVFAGFIGYFFYLTAKSTHVLIRPLRIDVEKGILSKNISSLELFRITDVDLQQGLVARLLGFGTIKLTTNDAESPELALYQIPRAREVRQFLQTQIPLAARQRGAVYMEK